jgi:hypothetical protein
MYHNRQWEPEQILALENRGQPIETFNVIKLMVRTLIGYYSAVVNRAVIAPKQYSDITRATLLNDALQAVYERNAFNDIDDDVKMYGMLTGLFVSYTEVRASGNHDIFGRNEYDIKIEAINPEEIVIDPLSRKLDYSDARGIHRFRWVDEDTLKKEFGKNQKTIDKLDEYFNHLDIDEAEFTYRYQNEFVGRFKVDNMYLVVHSIIGDESIFWCGDVELSRTKLDLGEAKSPYTVVRLHSSNIEEYYGLFREVIESQKAINQALTQIQLLVNSNKVFVQDGSVEDIDEFAEAVSRVNSVVEVSDLAGIRLENMSQDVVDQYVIIDKAFERIKLVLGVNDAMLGQAFAGDSGRKVKLQQNTGLMTLRYLTAPLETYHRVQAYKVTKLITKYFTSHQILRVTDEITGDRFIEINKPILLPKLPPELQQLVAMGMPIEYAMEALITGQLNPIVQQAIQQHQVWMQQMQLWEQEQQQLKAINDQIKLQMVNNQMSGQPPQITGNINHPGKPPMLDLQDIDLTAVAETSDKAKLNRMMAIKRPKAPPGLTYLYEEMINPATGEPERDKDGNILLVPASEADTRIDVKDYDVVIKPSSYNDEDEKAQLMLEVLLNGPAGQFAMNVSPAAYAKMVSLNVQTMKTKHSPEIAKIFNQLSGELGNNPKFEAYIRELSSGVAPQGQAGGMPTDDGNGGMIPSQGLNGGGPQSSALKLPTNTNEGF